MTGVDAKQDSPTFYQLEHSREPQHEIVTKKYIYNDTQQLQSMSKRVLVSFWTQNDRNYYCYSSIVIGSEFSLLVLPHLTHKLLVMTHWEVPKWYQIQW